MSRFRARSSSLGRRPPPPDHHRHCEPQGVEGRPSFRTGYREAIQKNERRPATPGRPNQSVRHGPAPISERTLTADSFVDPGDRVEEIDQLGKSGLVGRSLLVRARDASVDFAIDDPDRSVERVPLPEMEPERKAVVLGQSPMQRVIELLRRSLHAAMGEGGQFARLDASLRDQPLAVGDKALPQNSGRKPTPFHSSRSAQGRPRTRDDDDRPT